MIFAIKNGVGGPPPLAKKNPTLCVNGTKESVNVNRTKSGYAIGTKEVSTPLQYPPPICRTTLHPSLGQTKLQLNLS